MKIWPETVRWRLTLWYAALLAVPLVLFAAGSHYLLSNALTVRADGFLQEARGAFVAELGNALDDRPQSEALRSAMHDVHFRDIRFFVFDARDSLLAESTSIDSIETGGSIPPFIADLARRRLLSMRGATFSAPVMGMMVDGDSVMRVLVGGESLNRRPYTIAAVQSREGIRTTLSRVTVGYLVAIPFFLILASAGGYVLAGRALAPVALMSRQARMIGATNLHERLPVPRTQDELGELATLINELLQRLEQSFEHTRRFVANASHELRTPVAIVRAESEIALARQGRGESEYRDALGVVRDAADRLSRIVHDLFLFARADAGNTTARREPLYLDEMVSDVTRAMRGVAGQNDVRIDVVEVCEAPFVGDVELLSRMLLNLLDNAVKYSPRNTTVRVSLVRDNGTYRLSVADQGPGIPPEAQAHVFDRFFRVDTARSRTNGSATSGAGLGLAIVRLVAEVHGGHAELTRSTPEGSEFTAVLPIAASG